MRSLYSMSSFAVTALLLAACPGDDSSAEDGADSGSSGTTAGQPTTTEPTTTEPATTTADTGIATTTGEPTTTDATDSATTGPVAACGEVECSGAEWCDWSDDGCGDGGAGMSSCQARPEGCPEDYAPVCGCDGQVHPNECSATQAGADVDAQGECEAPEGYFRCGYRFCSIGVEYCQVQTSDIGGFADSYNCVLPAGECVGGITCDCLTEELCFDSGCNATPDGGIEIVCPGG